MKQLILILAGTLLFSQNVKAQDLSEVLSLWVTDAENGFNNAVEKYGSDGRGHIVAIENIDKIGENYYATIVLGAAENWEGKLTETTTVLDTFPVFQEEGWKIYEWEQGVGEKLTKGKNYEYYAGDELTHFITIYYGDNYTGEKKVVGMNLSAKCKNCEVPAATIE